MSWPKASTDRQHSARFVTGPLYALNTSNATRESVSAIIQFLKRNAIWKPLSEKGQLDTDERPFQCPCCEQSFRRSDVRALHVRKAHQSEFDAGAMDSMVEDNSEPKRKRVKTACDLCRKRKLRCDGESPCTQCHSSRSDCHYSSTSYSRRLHTREGASSAHFYLPNMTNLQDFSFATQTVPVLGPIGNAADLSHQDLVLDPMLPDLDDNLDLGSAIPGADEQNMLAETWHVPLFVGASLFMSVLVSPLTCPSDRWSLVG